MMRRDDAVRAPRPAPLPAASAGRESAGAPRSPATAVLGLQRTLGNRAVGALLRRGGAAGALQRFPYTVEDAKEKLVVVAKLEGSYIRLYVHGVEAGYLRIIPDANLWELKDIVVHDVNLRGRDLGSVLVYFFAMLAAANGAAGLAVLLPNGSALYARNGFVVTPNANPNNPPTITGVPATVRDAALANVRRRYRIAPGLPAPAQPAPRPNPRQMPKGGLINDNEFGNPAIGDGDL